MKKFPLFESYIMVVVVATAVTVIKTYAAAKTLITGVKKSYNALKNKFNKIGPEDTSIPQLTYAYSQNLSYGLYENNVQGDPQRRLYYDTVVFLRYKQEWLAGHNVSRNASLLWNDKYLSRSNKNSIDRNVSEFINQFYSEVSRTFATSTIGKQLIYNHLHNVGDNAGWKLVITRIKYWFDNLVIVAQSNVTNPLLKVSDIPVLNTLGKPPIIGILDEGGQDNTEAENIVPYVIGGGLILTKVL